VPAQDRRENVHEDVVADRADGADARPELRQVDGRAGGSARGGGADLLQDGAALAGRDRLHRPAEHVQDESAERHDPAE
jgi:hypothetical protein